MPATTDFEGPKAVDEVLNAAEAGIDRRLGDLALLAIGLETSGTRQLTLS